MRVFKSCRLGFALGSALLIILGLCPGCRTGVKAPLFAATGPDWRVQQGQALWKPRRDLPELAGELVVVSHPDGSCAIQFAKTPLTFVDAQLTPTQWLIQFPPRQLSFSGRRTPPTRFAWLYLPMALAGKSLPGRFHFQGQPDGGWRLENTRTGETIEGFLNP